jgi:hypothetical protein
MTWLTGVQGTIALLVLLGLYNIVGRLNDIYQRLGDIAERLAQK